MRAATTARRDPIMTGASRRRATKRVDAAPPVIAPTPKTAPSKPGPDSPRWRRSTASTTYKRSRPPTRMY
jgi:hypothetical protein